MHKKADGSRINSNIIINWQGKVKRALFQSAINLIPLYNHNILYKDIVAWKIFCFLKKKYQYVARENITELKGNYTIKEPSEKIVWWCWLQGIDYAPELCKACLDSVQSNAIGEKIIVITQNNYFEYVEIPEFIVKKWRRGIISNTHFSDILRLALLIKYGGVWIDSTVFCSQWVIPDSSLFVYKDNNAETPYIASSWLISSYETNNEILRLTWDFLCHYWQDYNYQVHYFIFHMFFRMACENYQELWERVPTFSNDPPHQLQRELFEKYSDNRKEQLFVMSNFHKLTYKHILRENSEETFWKRIITRTL